MALLPLLLLALRTATQTFAVDWNTPCYNPDGSRASRDDHPCFTDQEDSPCCTVGMYCTTSGVCETDTEMGNDTVAVSYSRGTCTDLLWRSKSCPRWCREFYSGSWNLISCANVTDNRNDFCCDQDDGCCDSGIGRFPIYGNDVVIVKIDSTPPESLRLPSSTSWFSSGHASSSWHTSSSQRTSTSTAAPTMTESVATATSMPSSALPAGSGGLSVGSKAGMGVGIVLSLMAVAALTGIILQRRRRKAPHVGPVMSVPVPMSTSPLSPSAGLVELGVEKEQVVELEDKRLPTELPGYGKGFGCGERES